MSNREVANESTKQIYNSARFCRLWRRCDRQRVRSTSLTSIFIRGNIHAARANSPHRPAEIGRRIYRQPIDWRYAWPSSAVIYLSLSGENSRENTAY